MVLCVSERKEAVTNAAWPSRVPAERMPLARPSFK